MLTFLGEFILVTDFDFYLSFFLFLFYVIHVQCIMYTVQIFFFYLFVFLIVVFFFNFSLTRIVCTQYQTKELNPMLPKGILPKVIIPNGMILKGIKPKGIFPKCMLPQGIILKGMLPKGIIPKGMFFKCSISVDGSHDWIMDKYSKCPYYSMLIFSWIRTTYRLSWWMRSKYRFI